MLTKSNRCNVRCNYQAIQLSEEVRVQGEDGVSQYYLKSIATILIIGSAVPTPCYIAWPPHGLGRKGISAVS